MKIGIDLMGGDNPQEIIGALTKFTSDYSYVKVLAYAKEEDANAKQLESIENVEIIYTKESITKDDDPAFVVRKKKDSSLIVGVQDLKDRNLDCYISAGNTAALVAAGIFVLKRKDGIAKPALPGFFPKKNSKTPIMMLDLGANIYATHENMIQYAEMSIDYMKTYYNIENPSIKLLNIGEEENKGTDLQKGLYEELSNMEINFKGNIEPRDVLTADCDIILMDGWTGNVVLKTLEGAVEFVGKNLKEVFYKRFINKMAALVIKKDLTNMYKELDYRELGATLVMGVDGLLLKAHGSSDERAFYNALKQAKNMVEKNG